MGKSRMKKAKQVSPKELRAFGVGLTVTVAAALLTSLVTPIVFPLNFLVSLALGGTAAYGALKVLDPRTTEDVLAAQTLARYRQMLEESIEVARRTRSASQDLGAIDGEISQRLESIAGKIERILERYQERRGDFAGLSSTLLILRKFAEVLGHYRKVKHGELFMDEAETENEIAKFEEYVVPMFEMAFINLGKRLDAGEILDKGISTGTLESMLQSLNLIESLPAQIDSPDGKGNPDV